MSGHGHVVPNKDGRLARCGGPSICSACARELAQATASTTAAMQAASDILNVDPDELQVTVPSRVLRLLLAEISELRRERRGSANVDKFPPLPVHRHTDIRSGGLPSEYRAEDIDGLK